MLSLNKLKILRDQRSNSAYENILLEVYKNKFHDNFFISKNLNKEMPY